MNWQEFVTLSPQTSLDRLQSRLSGLSSTQAADRLNRFGPNYLAAKQPHWPRILLRQIISPYVYLLLLAAVVSSWLESPINGAIILLFVVLNTVLGFYQEYRSDLTLKSLQKFLESQSRIRRDGKFQIIPSSQIVPGDIIQLTPGDILPADVRLLEQVSLTINESALTGESVSVSKSADPISGQVADYFQASNIGFSGTTVIKGAALGVVFATGQNSVFGQISHTAGQTETPSPFSVSLAKFSRFTLFLVLFTVFILFILHYLLLPSPSPISLLVFSLALAVSVIPEALPVVTTFALSQGASRLARHQVVVKRLSAIQDLGGVQVLCTDKTGTLTQNQLSFSGVYPANDRSPLIQFLASDHFSPGSLTDPFDQAVWQSLTPLEQTQLSALPVISVLPFDPVRRISSVLIRNGKDFTVVIRGAPEAVLAKSGHVSPGIRRWLTRSTHQGLRVLAVATASTSQNREISVLEDSLNFHLTGLLAFTDHLKPSAADAVIQAKNLGLQIKILTGDNPEVAAAIASQIGLISVSQPVFTGSQLEKLTPKAFSHAVHNSSVFARVNPQQKTKIIELLRRRYTVAYLGEGINDAIALKTADVGLVVREAADVARQSADIVLLDKDLGVIVGGVRIGRAISSNIGKYIVATLTSNFGHFIAIAVISLKVSFLPLLPLQLLLINLLSDFPMIAIATDHVEPAELATPSRFRIRPLLLTALVLGVVSAADDLVFFSVFSRFSPSTLRTYWFIGGILAELALLYSIRTRKLFFRAAPPAPLLVTLSLIAAFLTLVIPLTPIGRRIFSFSTVSLPLLGIIVLLVAAFFSATELVKLALVRFQSRS